MQIITEIIFVMQILILMHIDAYSVDYRYDADYYAYYCYYAYYRHDAY